MVAVGCRKARISGRFDFHNACLRDPFVGALCGSLPTISKLQFVITFWWRRIRLGVSALSALLIDIPPQTHCLGNRCRHRQGAWYDPLRQRHSAFGLASASIRSVLLHHGGAVRPAPEARSLVCHNPPGLIPMFTTIPNRVPKVLRPTFRAA
jgi:hypothetical protein